MPPISLLIKPASGSCQYKCRYCFYADVMNNREKKNLGIMSEDTLEFLVKRAFQYSEGSASFAFQGGEPTLAGLDYFKKLVFFQKKYTKGQRVFNSLQTNGALIDDEWASFLHENNFLVGLSVDGDEQTHNLYRKDADGKGTYEAVIRAAQTLQKHKVDFNILTVINKDVALKPAETYRALRDYGFLQFIPCIEDFAAKDRTLSPTAEDYGLFLIETFNLYKNDFDSGKYVSVRTFDNYVRMILGKRPESCSMTGRCTCYFVVEADGSVYPCDFYVLDEWKLGSVRDTGFGALIKTEAAERFVASSVYMHPECRTCKYYSLCRGGCRRDREPFDPTGKPALNRYCKSNRMFFDACYAGLKDIAKKLTNYGCIPK